MEVHLRRREIKVVGRWSGSELQPKRLKTGVAKTCTAAYVFPPNRSYREGRSAECSKVGSQTQRTILEDSGGRVWHGRDPNMSRPP